jgi:hypothetical protein
MHNPLHRSCFFSHLKYVAVSLLTGQALHAWRLQLQHPVTGELIEAIALLPDQFNTLLKILRLRANI